MSHLLQVRWKGSSRQTLPITDDCKDVDEVGTEPSSDADSDLFGLDRGGDPIATINSVTKRNDRTRGGKELLAIVDSGAVDNVHPKTVHCVSSGGDFQVAEWSCFQRSEQVTHQALSAAAFSSQDQRWKQHEHYLGGRRCAQIADLRQPSA